MAVGISSLQWGSLASAFLFGAIGYTPYVVGSGVFCMFIAIGLRNRVRELGTTTSVEITSFVALITRHAKILRISGLIWVGYSALTLLVDFSWLFMDHGNSSISHTFLFVQGVSGSLVSVVPGVISVLVARKLSFVAKSIEPPLA